MKSSPIIALFTEPPPSRRGPSAIFYSVVLHCIACVLIYLGLNQARKVDLRTNPRFAVRMMELRKTEPVYHRPVEKVLVLPSDLPRTPQAAPSGAPQTTAAASLPTNFVPQKQALQTLIQPEAPPDLKIPQEALLPQIVVWSSPVVPVKKIVQPTPPKPVQAAVRPSLETPNEEPRIADLKLSSSPFNTKAPLPPPSSTSPIKVQVTQSAPQQVPQTASKSTGPTAPASVISLSNVTQEGTAVLPMINEIAPAPYSGSLSAGQPKGLSQTGNGKAEAKESGSGAGHTSGAANGNVAAGKGSAGQSGANGQSGADASVTTGASLPGVVHITLPKDGKFGVVVVGSSVADDYPETLNMWSGRLAYTVYLHVGVTKNWILQYSLPRAQTVATGSVSRPDAPWPYDITRPSVDPDANTDAIMVHGFVNAAGRFERLAVVFPTELAEAKFLLHALQQWQFRPAIQNGQATAVEVLLIIPDQTE